MRRSCPTGTAVSEIKTINSVAETLEASPPPTDGLQDFILGRLIRMADSLYQSGEVRQAKFMFSKLREDYPASLEGEQASEHGSNWPRSMSAKVIFGRRSIYEELL